MKTPEQCADITDIRAEIDAIDREVVALIGKRAGYVAAASKFKTSASSVQAPERQRAMLEARRAWAAAEGLNPDVIEKMYRDLVAYFVSEEMAKWRENA